MRKYTKVGVGLWTRRRSVLLAAVLAAGCAHQGPRTYSVSEPASPPPPPPMAQAEEPVALREDAPLTYVVKKGDTLWDIANHFLLDPWQWPEIWVANNQVRNPHLIYPGDTLTLVWTNGRPGVTQAGVDNKLSPHIREESLEAAIPTIPLDAIRDFLKSPRLVTAEELARAPYVLDFVDPHIVGGADNDFYVKGLAKSGGLRFDAVRQGQRYVDPDSDEVLGWEAIYIGDAEVQELGTSQVPGMAKLRSSDRELKVGDHLIKPQGDSFEANFYPHAPAQPVRARILSVFDGVSQIGQYAVVTLSKGSNAGLEPGTVLAITQAGREARDPYTHHTVALPETYAGLVMVFKVETKVSYALVMKATREVHVLDYVGKPTSEQH